MNLAISFACLSLSSNPRKSMSLLANLSPAHFLLYSVEHPLRSRSLASSPSLACPLSAFVRLVPSRVPSRALFVPNPLVVADDDDERDDVRASGASRANDE